LKPPSILYVLLRAVTNYYRCFSLTVKGKHFVFISLYALYFLRIFFGFLAVYLPVKIILLSGLFASGRLKPEDWGSPTLWLTFALVLTGMSGLLSNIFGLLAKRTLLKSIPESHSLTVSQLLLCLSNISFSAFLLVLLFQMDRFIFELTPMVACSLILLVLIFDFFLGSYFKWARLRLVRLFPFVVGRMLDYSLLCIVGIVSFDVLWGGSGGPTSLIILSILVCRRIYSSFRKSVYFLWKVKIYGE